MVYSFEAQPSIAMWQPVVLEDVNRVRAARPGEVPMGIALKSAGTHAHVMLDGFGGGSWTPPAAIPAPRLVPRETCCHHCGGERWKTGTCYFCGTERR